MKRKDIRAVCLAAALLNTAAIPVAAGGPKFYPDDPLIREPRPRHVAEARPRKLSDYYDFFRNMFGGAGERITETGAPIPAQGVNTLGEPMEGAWWERRHYYRRMTIQELKAGPGCLQPPAPGKWTIVAAKSEGVTPGFTIKDSKGEVYFIKFDPLDYPELATAADMITSRILYAAGYHVPEYYIVHFRAEDLELGDDVKLRDRYGQKRPMKRKDVIELLLDAPRDRDGRWRAIASRLLPGKPLGPFRFDGTRSDDPNDTVPHEHRRELRGYRVLCAWVNHDDSRAVNTLDMLQKDPDGRQYIKHYLIDFGSTLGSATSGPNSPRGGAEYLWDMDVALKQLFSLGFYIPQWARARHPEFSSVGHFESRTFDPERWVPEYPNPAFVNALPDDLFWGAKLVMAFTDAEIRAIVETAEYSDPLAANYVVRTLIERRDKIGRAFFAKLLPLDKFAVREGRLVFEDLEVKHGFVASRDYRVTWMRFDNETGARTAIEGAVDFFVPECQPGAYLAAEITARDRDKPVTVYLRNQAGALEVVGIDRTY